MTCDCCGQETDRPVVVEIGRQRVRRLCRGCFRGDPLKWAGFYAGPPEPRGGRLEIALVCVMAAVMLAVWWWSR